MVNKSVNVVYCTVGMLTSGFKLVVLLGLEDRV